MSHLESDIVGVTSNLTDLLAHTSGEYLHMIYHDQFMADQATINASDSYRQSYFVKLVSQTNRTFDENGIEQLANTGGSGNGTQVPSNPVGGYTNPVTTTNKAALISMIQNEPSQAVVDATLISNSPLEEEILEEYIVRGGNTIKQVLDEQSGLTEPLIQDILLSQSISSSTKTTLLDSLDGLSDTALERLMVVNYGFTEQQIQQLLLDQTQLSSPMQDTLISSAHLSNEVVASVLKQQPVLDDNQLRDLMINKPDFEAGYLRELFIAFEITDDLHYNQLLQHLNNENQVLLKSIMLSGSNYPSEMILTTLGNDANFDRTLLEDILLGSPYALSGSLRLATANWNIDEKVSDKLDDLATLELPYSCGPQAPRTYSIENITEYEYYESDPRGYTTSNAYKKLLGLEDETGFYLKHEPSWQVYKVLNYSPQTPGAYSSKEYFYYYDLRNRYDRLHRINYFADDDFEVGLDAQTDDVAWFESGAIQEIPNPDALAISDRLNLRSLAFQSRDEAKSQSFKTPFVKDMYYFLDARWENADEPTFTTVNVAPQDCYIFDEIEDFQTGRNLNVRSSNSRELPYNLRLKGRLYLRSTYTQIDTLSKQSYEDDCYTEVDDPLLDFWVERGQNTDPDTWHPFFPYDVLRIDSVVERNSESQPVLTLNSIETATKYFYSPRTVISYMSPDCDGEAVQFSVDLTPNSGLPEKVVVAFDQPNELATEYTYHVDKSVNEILEPNALSKKYEYDTYGRLHKSYLNDRLISENRYSYWYRDWTENDDQANDFEFRASKNYVETFTFREDGTLEAQQTRAFIDPFGREHSTFTSITADASLDLQTDLAIHSGLNIYDGWDRIVQKYNPFKVTGLGTITAIPRNNIDENTDTEFIHVQFENDWFGRELAHAKQELTLGGDHNVRKNYKTLNHLAFICELGLSQEEIDLYLSQSPLNHRIIRIQTTDEDNKIVFEYYNTLEQKLATRARIDDYEDAITLFVYDAQGNVAETINPEKQSSYYRYNILGQMYEQETVDGDKTKYMYNKLGNVSLTQDANGAAGILADVPSLGVDVEMVVPYYTEFTFDNLGRPLTQSRVAIHPENITDSEITLWIDPLLYETTYNGGYWNNDTWFEEGLLDQYNFTEDFRYIFSNNSTYDWMASIDAYEFGDYGVSGAPGVGFGTFNPVSKFNFIQPEKEFTYNGHYPDGMDGLWLYPSGEENQMFYLDNEWTNTDGMLSSTLVWHNADNHLEADEDVLPIKMDFYAYNEFGQMRWELQQFNFNGISEIARGTLTRIDYPSYDYQGNLLEQNIDINCDQVLDLQYYYEYDAFLRLTKVYGNMEDVGANGNVLAEYTYEDKENTLINTTYKFPGMTCDFKIGNTFDTRKRLSQSTSDIYTEKMFYDNALVSYDGTALDQHQNYNGNINGVEHQYTILPSEVENAGDANILFDGNTYYGFSYDGINRLTHADGIEANYFENSQASEEYRHQNGDVTYHFDRIGNFSLLKRYGRHEVGGGWLNHMQFFGYNYTPGTNMLEEANGINSATDSRAYTYDANGNLLTDDYKTLSSTVYSRANLPVKLTMNEEGGTQKVYHNYYYDVNDMRIAKESVNTLLVENSDIYIRDFSGKELAVVHTVINDGGGGGDPVATTWNYYFHGANRFAKLEPNEDQAPSFDPRRFARYTQIDDDDVVTQQIISYITNSVSYPIDIALGTLDGDDWTYTWDYYTNEVLTDTTINFVLRQQVNIKSESQLLALDRSGGRDPIAVSVDDIKNGGVGDPGYREDAAYGVYLSLEDTQLPMPSYYQYDHLGNTRVVFTPFEDAQGNYECLVGQGDGAKLEIETLLDYYPYGKVLREFHFDGNERYMTTQHERDQETQLDYRGARFYDGDIGRFLSVDPHADRYPSWTPYHYVHNNPIIMVDPDGRDAIVTIKGSTITVSSKIYIYGSGASKSTASLMQSNIMGAWGANPTTGKGWQYTDASSGKTYDVVFDVQVELYNPKDASDEPGLFSGKNNPFNRDNYIEVDNASKKSFVRGGDEGVWRGKGRGGKTLAADDSAPHEFGHLIGFKDRYNKSGAMTGWTGNIMAEPAMKGNVEQKNIDALINPLVKEYNDSWTKWWNPNADYKTSIDYSRMQYEPDQN